MDPRGGRSGQSTIEASKARAGDSEMFVALRPAFAGVLMMVRAEELLFMVMSLGEGTIAAIQMKKGQ